MGTAMAEIREDDAVWAANRAAQLGDDEDD
jgi:hypothetical protein